MPRLIKHHEGAQAAQNTRSSGQRHVAIKWRILVPGIEEEDVRPVGLGAFFEFLCIVRRCNASFDGGGRHARIEAN
jgi:hypothetical protein